MLLADPANTAVLTDSAGLNGQPTSVIVSNAAALKSLKNSADFTTGVLAAGTSVTPGQLLQRGPDWYIIAKVLNLAAITLAPYIPVQVQLQHLLPPFAGTRGVGGAAISLRMVVRDDKESQDPAVARDRLDGIAPAGADVDIGDLYTYGLWVYRVDDVAPAAVDGHQYGQDVHLSKVAPAAGNAEQYMLFNALVTGYRGGVNGGLIAPAYDHRRVEFRWSRPDDRDTGEGVLIAAHLSDTPDAQWRRGDWVDIIAIDGITAALPASFGLEVHAVHPVADPLAHVDVELTGEAL